jgi:prolyl 4-hydroxylase
MIQKLALSSLPRDWQNWVEENLARSCDPRGMAEIMVRDGRFDPNLVRAALEEASSGKDRITSPAVSMPDIDTSSNAIRTSDRTIDVLLTLESPRIVLLGNVLSAEECDALVDYCQPRLQRSPVVDDGDGTMQMHAQRTSRGAMIQRAEIPLVECVEARLAEIARWPVGYSEGLQIQQYQANDEYRPHFDWFDPALPGPRKHMEHGGQRLATFIIYLSDVECGGGTAFPAIGLDVLPKRGGAVFFQNTNSSRVPDRRTLHAGSPVERGVKSIANKWLRERAY